MSLLTALTWASPRYITLHIHISENDHLYFIWHELLMPFKKFTKVPSYKVDVNWPGVGDVGAQLSYGYILGCFIIRLERILLWKLFSKEIVWMRPSTIDELPYHACHIYNPMTINANEYNKRPIIQR